MLNESQRLAILALRAQGLGARQIGRTLGIARNSVKQVLRANSPTVPPLTRDELCEPHRQEILELYALCKGNLVRVHEELATKGTTFSYPALTAFCRRHGIGHEPKKPAGQYHFEPGEEMQHDTSPHDVELGGRVVRAQTASLVLCHSRMLFFQHYPAFDRFTCKLFLTEALTFFGGAARRCMIDNTHVVVLRGTGARMEPVPEMAAFAERFGFSFAAHEVGDADRSGRVERPFSFIEGNFLAHRPARDWNDLNRQARDWCDKANGTWKKHLHAVPRELFAVERLRLVPLPAHVPDVYRLHHRIVDVEGYVNLHGHKYSVPYALIGRQLETHETKDQLVIFHGPRIVARHPRCLLGGRQRLTLAEHRPPRGQVQQKLAVPPEQQELSQQAPELSAYLDALREKTPGRSVAAGRRLLRMLRDYPRAPLLDAVRVAHEHRLFDLDRLERMVLVRIARDFFPGRPDPEEDP